MKLSHYYLELISLMKCENDRIFFEELFSKMQVHLKIKSGCIVSTPNQAETNYRKMRILAGKTIAQDVFWEKCKNINREDSFYFLGRKKDQYYFFVSVEDKISQDEVNYLQIFVGTYFDLSQRFLELKKNQDLIYIDDVSGLYNQRKLNIDLNSFIARYEKHQHTFCVLFMDVDYFKKVNDSYGHLVGTKLLEMLAVEFRSLLRDGDLLYRYGGDEFVVLLPDTQLEGGKIVGERILNHVGKHSFKVDTLENHLTLNMSLSIGVAECPRDAKNINELLSFADKMMYGAKSSGRGTVFYAHDQLSLKKQRA